MRMRSLQGWIRDFRGPLAQGGVPAASRAVGFPGLVYPPIPAGRDLSPVFSYPWEG
jgi:hypothetical protein